MAGDEHFLRPILDAGSSRVFNCNDRLKRLVEEKVADPYFFKIEAMHSLVLVKEAIPGPTPSDTGKIIGTKLYFPYNRDNIYEGGRSIFYHSPGLFDVLNEQFGLCGEKASDQDIARDIKILSVLDQLPSLDGFLMSDALRTERIVANELYFEVADEERVAIQDYIAKKFLPLVQAAFGTQDALQGKVSQLVEKSGRRRTRLPSRR